jgi:hypothetical protein
LKIVLKWNISEDLDIQVKLPNGDVVFSPFQSDLPFGGRLDQDDGLPTVSKAPPLIETITFPIGYPRGTYTAIVSNAGVFYPNAEGFCHNGINFELKTYVCNILQSTVSTSSSQAQFDDQTISFQVV